LGEGISSLEGVVKEKVDPLRMPSLFDPSFYFGRKVFITGHTGFKGAWLCLWLHQLGAKVTGYALPPPTEPSLFELCGIGSLVHSVIADVRDANSLKERMAEAEPEIVIHMAAQPLVRDAYEMPVDTYAVNVMGTVNVLEAVRTCDSVKAVVIVTTDKCYEERDLASGFKESDPLGGVDPYSSSKACSEIVTAAYRRSFFGGGKFANHEAAIASARAGNVIGGGDWARDRLVPDFLRALDRGETVKIRSPKAIRPWQHVLEPLSGYLGLAEYLYKHGGAYAEGWNFGPSDEDARTVRWIVERLVAASPGSRWECDPGPQPHEAYFLKLDSSKARARLGWEPRWRLETALEKTIEWHTDWRRGKDMRAVSLAQITEYAPAEPTP
jgi:CDP-glucose 4,6-dehydratase